MLLERFRSTLASRRGFTALETIISISIFTILAMGGVSLMVAAAASWNREIAQSEVNSDTSRGLKAIAQELRPALSVSIDGDGQGISYRLPRRDTQGHIIIPVSAESTVYRIYRSQDGSSLMRTGRTRPLVSGLPDEDDSGAIFHLQPSGKAVCVSLTSTVEGPACDYTSTKTEVVRLRNVQ